MMLYKKKFDTFELNKTNYIAPTHDLYAEWNLHICISCLQTKINVKTHSLFLLDCLLMRVKQYFFYTLFACWCSVDRSLGGPTANGRRGGQLDLLFFLD